MAACALAPSALWAGAATASNVPLATVKAPPAKVKIPITKVKALAPLTLGFSAGADTVLATGNASTQALWVPRAQSEGAQMLRLSVLWNQVAPKNPESGFNAANPADPGYNWTKVDEQVREMTATGAKLLVTVGNAPTWAEGANMPKSAFAGTWEPSATDFGEFAQAIATRYDGSYPDPLNPGRSLPRVSIWQGWNEPNLPEEITPQYVQTATGYQETAATIYANLENAFYVAVKGVSSSNYVVLAGLAPYGDSPSTFYADRTRPVAFLQSLLCVTPSLHRAAGCTGPTYFDAIDSHPYGIYGPNWHAYWANDVSIPDVYKLVRVLNAAEKLGTALPHGHKANWVTETSWDSNPPNPGGVPIQQQALWMEQAMYNLWKQGVSTILWWQLADDPASTSTYQAGTYFLDGQAKPSATAFRFPLVTHRQSYKTVVAWSRAPATGIVAVQEQTGSGWRTVARARVKANEVFELPLHLIFRETLRATLGVYTSLSVTQAG